jgi:hypothetical protein
MDRFGWHRATRSGSSREILCNERRKGNRIASSVSLQNAPSQTDLNTKKVQSSHCPMTRLKSDVCDTRVRSHFFLFKKEP